MMAAWIRLVLISSILFALLIAVDCDDNSTVIEQRSGLYNISYVISATKSNDNDRDKRCSSYWESFWERTKEKTTWFFERLVPNGIRKMFTKTEKNKTVDEKNDNETRRAERKSDDKVESDNEEHGSLDFIGRDIIRGISNTASKVSKKLGFNSSNKTAGLDANKTFFDGVADKFQEHVSTIYPGTLWCGGGNKAKSYDDLGYFNDTDACCRDHDECPENMDAGATKHGLINTGLFTRSHCDCDQKFYDCLKKTNSGISKKIGFTYFTVLGPQCYKEDYKITDCAKIKSGRCVDYETERSNRKEYQWFDNPVF